MADPQSVLCASSLTPHTSRLMPGTPFIEPCALSLSTINKEPGQFPVKQFSFSFVYLTDNSKYMTSDNKPGKNDLPVILFETSDALNTWLEKNHKDSPGIWVRFFKKSSGGSSINYEQALNEALCFGWIDGQVKTFDEQSYIQKFTPRRARSIWSKRNIERINNLEEEGRMRSSGMKEVAEAKADGRWENAYDSPSKMNIPEDLINELSKDPKTADFFNNLSKANKYAITWRLQTAKKPETREKRMRSILEMLSKGKTFH